MDHMIISCMFPALPVSIHAKASIFDHLNGIVILESLTAYLLSFLVPKPDGAEQFKLGTPVSFGRARYVLSSDRATHKKLGHR